MVCTYVTVNATYRCAGPTERIPRFYSTPEPYLRPCMTLHKIQFIGQPAIYQFTTPPLTILTYSGAQSAFGTIAVTGS